MTTKRDDLARGLVSDTPSPERKVDHPDPSAEPQPDLVKVPVHELMESARKFHHPDPGHAPEIPLGANPDNLPMRADADPEKSAAHSETTYGVAKDELEDGKSPKQSAAKHPGKPGTGEPNRPVSARQKAQNKP